MALNTLTWVSFWDPSLTNNLLNKSIKFTQESRWLINNFPISSNFYSNTKAFTSAKLFISQPHRTSKKLNPYYITNYNLKSTGNDSYSTSPKLNSSNSLTTNHFSFFETSRFFTDVRTYNSSGLSTYLLSNLPSLQLQRVNRLQTSAVLGLPTTSQNSPQLLEPYTPHYFKGKSYDQLSNYGATAHTHKFLKPFIFTKSDLIFSEFLNTTSSSYDNQVGIISYVNLNIPIFGPNEFHQTLYASVYK